MKVEDLNSTTSGYEEAPWLKNPMIHIRLEIIGFCRYAITSAEQSNPDGKSLVL